MNATGSPIPLEKKQNVRRDFVLGRGSIRTLAKRYDVANGTIQKWAEGEKWAAMRELFASEDELIECKRQAIQLNAAIAAAGHDAEKLHLLVKSKLAIMDVFFRITLHPRCPIAKPEKPKNDQLARLLEQAAKRHSESDIPIDAAAEPGRE